MYFLFIEFIFLDAIDATLLHLLVPMNVSVGKFALFSEKNLHPKQHYSYSNKRNSQ